jgi:hypothetical protein
MMRVSRLVCWWAAFAVLRLPMTNTWPEPRRSGNIGAGKGDNTEFVIE